MLVYRNWFLGKQIAEEEVKGAARAEYGKEDMIKLVTQLTAKYGPGILLVCPPIMRIRCIDEGASGVAT